MPRPRTIYCPACGQLCSALRTEQTDDEETATVRCSTGHGWVLHVDWDADSDDGTSIISFQCDGTPAYALPEIEEKP